MDILANWCDEPNPSSFVSMQRCCSIDQRTPNICRNSIKQYVRLLPLKTYGQQWSRDSGFLRHRWWWAIRRCQRLGYVSRDKRFSSQLKIQFSLQLQIAQANRAILSNPWFYHPENVRGDGVLGMADEKTDFVCGTYFIRQAENSYFHTSRIDYVFSVRRNWRAHNRRIIFGTKLQQFL